MKKIFIILGFSLIAISERLFFDLGPNIELITMATLIVGMHFGLKESSLTVLIIAIVSDLVLGNSRIFLFTWSGFLIPVLLIKVFNLVSESRASKRIIVGSGVGMMSNFLFYIWTNFGVWALDSFDMYPNNILGLYMSYINGLPFLKMQLVSNLIIIPSVLVIGEGIIFIVKYLRIASDDNNETYINNL